MGSEAAEHFARWLERGLTGCMFANWLANKPDGLAIVAHVDVAPPPPLLLNNAFDAHAINDRAVIAVFPQVADERALVEFLRALNQDERWSIRRNEKFSSSRAVLVGLEWITAWGDRSATMGFAPFPTMPVPRRAPYVAIATWPGGRRNQFRGQHPTPRASGDQVGFLDAAHGLSREEYEKRWAATGKSVAALMSIPKDDAKLYREVAFAISPEHGEQLFAVR